MKFMCFGYADEKLWESMPENERNAWVDECFAYDGVLKKNGHWAGGEALAPSGMTRTLRWKGGRVAITDGPYAEAKEHVGGVLVLEARDIRQAVELMSKHPGVRAGGWEIRPVGDLSGMIAESERRRAKKPARG